MAWTAPRTWVATETLTAALLNTHLRDNLLETAPAKATGVDEYFVGTAANIIAARTLVIGTVGTTQTTTSVTFTDLATVGPAVGPIATGTKALIFLSGSIANDTAGSFALMSVAVSGATTLAANNAFSLGYESSNANDQIRASYVFPIDTLIAGNNTFTSKYGVTAGTGTFSNRRISVLAF